MHGGERVFVGKAKCLRGCGRSCKEGVLGCFCIWQRDVIVLKR